MAPPKKSITKEYTFGTCAFSRTSPQRETLSPSTKALNIIIPFEEAMRLNLAIAEGVRSLNTLKGSTREGRNAALNLTVFLSSGRITINQGRV